MQCFGIFKLQACPRRPIQSQFFYSRIFFPSLQSFSDFQEHGHLQWNELNSLYNEFEHLMYCLNFKMKILKKKLAVTKVHRMLFRIIRWKYTFAIGFGESLTYLADMGTTTN